MDRQSTPHLIYILMYNSFRLLINKRSNSPWSSLLLVLHCQSLLGWMHGKLTLSSIQSLRFSFEWQYLTTFIISPWWGWHIWIRSKIKYRSFTAIYCREIWPLFQNLVWPPIFLLWLFAHCALLRNFYSTLRKNWLQWELNFPVGKKM